jgi:hypothetical protein
LPEFYDGGVCRLQPLAQPYLGAIACGVRDNSKCRDYLIDGTEYELSYKNCKPLWTEQWKQRDPGDKMKCPFWSNYWYNPCKYCNCKIEKSVSMEIDAIFFFQNSQGRRLAIHIEMKRVGEPLSGGQAEAYRPRAACFRDGRRERAAILPHHDFLTVLFCGKDVDVVQMKRHFDQVIYHNDASLIFPSYPAK